MNRPAVFFDRDNTLIACDGYLGDPDKVVLVDGAADAVARVRELGFAAVVFSNQSGVARGMFPEEAVHAVNHRMDDLLHEENPRATIDRHDFCPFHPTAKVERYRVDSDLRKPKPGMIHQAAGVLNLDLKRSWVVGDAPRDIAAGQAAGLRTVLLKIASLPPSPATNEGAGASPDYVASSLKDAIDFIERNIAVPTTVAAQAVPAVAAVSPTAAQATSIPTPVTPAEPAKPSNGDAWTSTTSAPTANRPAEEPVKPTLPSKPTLTIKPAASRNEQRPEGAKQGGFVVKPNQPPPTGLTWGERMRVAKGGSPLTSAVSAARPEIPKPTITQAAPAPEAAVAETEVEPPPVREVIMRTIPQPRTVEPPEQTPAPTQDQAPVQSRAEVPVEPSASTTAEVRAEEPAPSPIAEAVVAEASAEPVSMAVADNVAANDADIRSEASTVSESPTIAATPSEPVAAAAVRNAPEPEPSPATSAVAETSSEPRRGLRREDLVERSDTTGAKPEPRSAGIGDGSRVEALLEQILLELRRRDDASAADFSVPKLIAGITQVLALAALFIAYLNKDTHSFQPTLLVAIALQTLTISLLIMGKQR